MSPTVFSERVNAVSNMITAMTADPAERLGIATAVGEIYKYELQKYFTTVTPPGGENAEAKPATAAAGAETK